MTVPIRKGSDVSPVPTGTGLTLPARMLTQTFKQLRACGKGARECQVLWTGPWHSPGLVTEVVHPKHRARGDGFVLDDRWLTTFWAELAVRNYGIRAQVHTHPQRAFHSETDDAWPIIHTTGFFSLVIPNFALGPIGFNNAYLAELNCDGRFIAVDPMSRITIRDDVVCGSDYSLPCLPHPEG